MCRLMKTEAALTPLRLTSFVWIPAATLPSAKAVRAPLSSRGFPRPSPFEKDKEAESTRAGHVPTKSAREKGSEETRGTSWQEEQRGFDGLCRVGSGFGFRRGRRKLTRRQLLSRREPFLDVSPSDKTTTVTDCRVRGNASLTSPQHRTRRRPFRYHTSHMLLLEPTVHQE